jgi:hypothetical protein
MYTRLSACLLSLALAPVALAAPSCPSGVPTLNLGSMSAVPGERVTMPLVLTGRGASIGSVATMLEFAASDVAFVGSDEGSATAARNGTCVAQSTTDPSSRTHVQAGCFTTDFAFFRTPYGDGPVATYALEVLRCPPEGVIRIGNVPSAATTEVPAQPVDGLCGLDGVIRCDECAADPAACAASTLCHKAKIPKGAPKFPAVEGVEVSTALRSDRFDVSSPNRLCATTGESDAGDVAYRIKPPRGAPKVVGPAGIDVTNDFGPLVLDVTKPAHLRMPTDVASGPYACFGVKITKGAPKFSGARVSAGDQLVQPPRAFGVVRPKHLCVAAGVNGGAIATRAAPLVCYAVKLVKGEADVPKTSGLQVGTAFGALTLDADGAGELCVPSDMEVAS